jgi:cGMP-dependent protein kinase
MKDPITNKTLRIYDEGNCFGELSILNETLNSSNFIASELTICYIINTDDFFELLKEQSANDYLKSKMLLEDNDISLNDLYYISYLGRGRFGNVCLVHNKICFYAAKAVSRLAAEKQKTGVKNLVNEKKTMITLDHPFVVKLVKTLKLNNWCFLLEEYIPGKNFGEYLDQRKHKENVYETKFFGANLFEIISYLNKRKIIHRDIKPSNIMLDSNGYLKLIDFGTSRKLKNYSETVIGTPNFIAPEILLGKGYSFPCDYWSIGVCIFYIYFGTLPFGNKAIELFDIYKEIIEKDPDYPHDAPSEIKNIINGLLCKKANLRINSLEKVQEQNLFKDFPWENLKKMKIKPFFIPHRDHRDNLDNLMMVNSPFISFMEN